MTSKTRVKTIAEEYLKNGLNGKRAVMKFRPDIQENSAEVIASRLLNNDMFKESIQEVINENPKLRKSKVLSKLASNIYQEKHLPSSNSAMDMYFKLQGDYAAEKKEIKSLNINYNDKQQVIKRLKDLEEELNEVRSRDSKGA
jgi:hypothetical protein